MVFAFGVVGISFAAIFVRLALPAPPIVTGFYRMLFASVVLVTWQATRPRATFPRGRALGMAVAAGVCFGTDLAFWNTAIVQTSVANATLLVNTTPVYVGAFSLLVWRERLGRPFLAGAALALAGTAILLGTDLGAPGSVRGDALALVAALFYAGYLLFMKVARDAADAIGALAAACAGSAAALLAYAVAHGDPLTGFPAHSWTVFVAAAGVSQIGGVLGIVWALRYLSATFTSVALLGQPVGTALIGWWLLGESLGGLQAVGAAAVLGGIALASRSAPIGRGAR